MEHRLKPAILVALLFVPSLGVAIKFLGVALSAAYVAGLLGAVAAVMALERTDRYAILIRRGEVWLAVAWIALMAVALATLYPIAQSRAFGVGSDRDDALMVGIEALLAGRYPYYARVYRGDVLSPMPGSLLLGIPFHLLGSVVAQNFFFAVAGALGLARCLHAWRTRWLLIALLSLGNLAFLRDYITGGDYAIAAIYVGMAFLLCTRALDRPETGSGEVVLTAALLGLAVCSRPIYPLAIIVLTAYAVRRHGWRRAVVFAAAAFGTAAAVTLPFYLYDPASFSPLHVLKLLPPWLRSLNTALPLLAVAVAVVPAFRDFGRWGLLAVLAAALGVILGPGSIARSLAFPLSYEYMLPVGLLGAAALLGMWQPPRRA